MYNTQLNQYRVRKEVSKNGKFEFLSDQSEVCPSPGFTGYAFSRLFTSDGRVPFDGVIADTASSFNQFTGTFTCPTSGVYAFMGSFMSDDQYAVSVEMYKEDNLENGKKAHKFPLLYKHKPVHMSVAKGSGCRTHPSNLTKLFKPNCFLFRKAILYRVRL